jgi:hypothetical protein
MSTDEAITCAKGKVIKVIRLTDDKLRMYFSDGSHLLIWDDGQSCCEHRHMSTDDDLTYYEGTTLVDIKLLAGPDIDTHNDYDEDSCHEQEFLRITTSKGDFTIVNHNEHNGYYSGFDIVVEYCM